MTDIWGGNDEFVTRYVSRIFAPPLTTRDRPPCVVHGLAHPGRACAEMTLPDDATTQDRHP